jgi:hypothetical protein
MCMREVLSKFWDRQQERVQKRQALRARYEADRYEADRIPLYRAFGRESGILRLQEDEFWMMVAVIIGVCSISGAVWLAMKLAGMP